MRESRFGMLRGNIGVARLPMLNGFIKGPALFFVAPRRGSPRWDHRVETLVEWVFGGAGK